MDERYINQIEVINNIFSVINGDIKILLIKRKTEPFKGYWMLPSNLLMTSETIEQCSTDTLKEYFKDITPYIEQSDIKSDINRLPNDRILACSMLVIVNYNSLNTNSKDEYRFFNINEIPKLVYDHDVIINNNIKILKNKIKNNQLINIFYKSDFTLPELQKSYEIAYDKKFDRRNFRKKLVNAKIIEDTGFKFKNQIGRPAKLYRFQNNENNFLDL